MLPSIHHPPPAPPNPELGTLHTHAELWCTPQPDLDVCLELHQFVVDKQRTFKTAILRMSTLTYVYISPEYSIAWHAIAARQKALNQLETIHNLKLNAATRTPPS